jgi:Restriction endonuclease
MRKRDPQPKSSARHIAAPLEALLNRIAFRNRQFTIVAGSITCAIASVILFQLHDPAAHLIAYLLVVAALFGAGCNMALEYRERKAQLLNAIERLESEEKRALRIEHKRERNSKARARQMEKEKQQAGLREAERMKREAILRNTIEAETKRKERNSRISAIREWIDGCTDLPGVVAAAVQAYEANVGPVQMLIPNRRWLATQSEQRKTVCMLLEPTAQAEIMDVSELIGWCETEAAQSGHLISIRGFSPACIQLAVRNPEIQLVDSHMLAAWIADNPSAESIIIENELSGSK